MPRKKPSIPADTAPVGAAVLPVPQATGKGATKTKQPPALRRLEAAISEAEEPSKRVLASRALILCPLPFRNPKVEKLTRYARTPAGPMEVTFSSVFDKVPLPHGNDAVLLDLLCSEARRTKSPVVTFDRAKELLELLGMEDTESGWNYQRVAARLERLASLVIAVRYPGERIGAPYRVSCGYDLPSDRDAKREGRNEKRLIPYHVTFSPEFWADMVSHYVPLPDGVLKSFRGNPTQYALAKRILYRAQFSRTSTLVPWADLLAESGSGDGNPWRFRDQVRKVLTVLRPMMRDMPVVFAATKDGLRITKRDSLASVPLPTLEG